MILQVLSIVGFGLLGGIFLFLFPFLLIKLMLILLFVSIIFRRSFRRFHGGRFHGRRFYGRGFHPGYGNPYANFYAENEFRGGRFRNQFYGPQNQQGYDDRETLQDNFSNRTPISI